MKLSVPPGMHQTLVAAECTARIRHGSIEVNTADRDPAGRHRLEAGQIVVWRAALDEHAAEQIEWLEALLAEDERERAQRFFFDRDRRRFVVARGILRVLLGGYLNRSPGEVELRYGGNGKPAVEAPVPLYFNVTHSDGLALYAFTRAGEIGVDLERLREMPDWESVAQASFTPDVLERLRACAPEQRRDEFFRAWTRQEAILKALGTGLAGIDNAGREHVSVRAVDVEPGYVAAVAFLHLASDQIPDPGSVVRAAPGAFPIPS